MREQETVTRMYLVDLERVVSDADLLDDLLDRLDGLWTDIHDEMDDEETLWVFAPNRYGDDGCWPVAMAVADAARAETGLILKNVITRHRSPDGGGGMTSTYEEIIFFVKDKGSYRFDKDPIRIAHVYEGNDWTGNRTSGTSAYHDTEVRRYNPNGKDPGNVWLDERRDDTTGQTVDEVRPVPRAEALRRCLRAGSDAGERVDGWFLSEAFHDVIEESGREIAVRRFERSPRP